MDDKYTWIYNFQNPILMITYDSFNLNLNFYAYCYQFYFVLVSRCVSVYVYLLGFYVLRALLQWSARFRFAHCVYAPEDLCISVQVGHLTTIALSIVLYTIMIDFCYIILFYIHFKAL